MKKIFFTMSIMSIMAMFSCNNPIVFCETIPKSDLKSGQELCEVTGGAKHFRIELLKTAVPHSAFILFMGFDANSKLPTGRGEKLKPDQFKAQFYHGGTGTPPMRPSGNTTFYLGKEGTFIEHNKFNAAAIIVCLDVSSEKGKPTMMTYWVHGEKGANCKNFTNLTSTSAQATKSWSSGETIAIKKNYIYQSAGVSPKKVVVFNETKGK